ncbi:MAG: hypothetical protein HZB35_10745 [Nitrospirae bacterium]|nr:hypothetical protein [Nitrospirota bacterium]
MRRYCATSPVDELGIALASHLAARKVAQRMADSAREVLVEAGHQPAIQLVEDTTAQQPGAVLALFADLYGGVRLGADRAGAFRRSAERIGHSAAR